MKILVILLLSVVGISAVAQDDLGFDNFLERYHTVVEQIETIKFRSMDETKRESLLKIGDLALENFQIECSLAFSEIYDCSALAENSSDF